MNQITGNREQFAISSSINPFPLVIVSIIFIILGLLGLLFVAPATMAMFRGKNTVLVSLGKCISSICLLATTSYYVWLLTVLPNISLNTLHTPLNWIGYFTFGGMGLFVAIVGVLVWISGIMPKGFVLVCAVKTLGFWTILLGIILSNFTIAIIGAVVGGLVGGVTYHTWLGIALLRKSK